MLGVHVSHFGFELESDALLIFTFLLEIKLLLFYLLIVVTVLGAQFLILFSHDLDLSLEYKLFTDHFEVLLA